MPKCVLYFTTPNDIMGVLIKSFANNTFIPCARKTFVTVSANNSPANRQS